MPNDSGIDGLNLVGYRFAAPIKNTFNTGIGRVDYRMAGNHSLFGRFNLQNDEVVGVPQFEGQAPNTTRKVKSRGVALGWDAVLSSTMVNTFRYGLTTIKEDIVGLQTSSQVSFRNIDNFDALTASSGRDIPTHSFVNDLAWVKGSHTLKFGANMRFSRVGTTQQRQLVPHPERERIVGGRRRHELHARGRAATRAGCSRLSPTAASRRSATRSCRCSASSRRPRRTTTTTARATCCP